MSHAQECTDSAATIDEYNCGAFQWELLKIEIITLPKLYPTSYIGNTSQTDDITASFKSNSDHLAGQVVWLLYQSRKLHSTPSEIVSLMFPLFTFLDSSLDCSTKNSQT